jgi:D-arabinose 1-dehydrogenase-like Zn-dependent alcohol dehydrogenase
LGLSFQVPGKIGFCLLRRCHEHKQNYVTYSEQSGTQRVKGSFEPQCTIDEGFHFSLSERLNQYQVGRLDQIGLPMYQVQWGDFRRRFASLKSGSE